jgi:aryl-alcohol dehydrogenase-like predicted oxidoreductase
MMRYARLGDTGLIVSKLALGAMTFGEGEGKGTFAASIYKVDQAGADRLVSQALDAGINYFNTADAYAGGRSEQMLGKALGSRRAEAIIATKVANRMGPALIDQGLSRRQILACADASLKRLGTDWIDVYLVHRLDPYTPLEETLQALQSLVSAGKVRYIGFSNWPAWLAAKAIGIQRANGWEPFRAAEMYYSLVGRDLEHEVVPFALDAGVGVQVWSPLAGGFLSGKYSRENPTGGGGRLSGFDFIPFDRDRGYALVERLRGMAKALNATPAQLAIAWLLDRPAVSSVLIGASTPAQLTDNLAAAQISLSEADRAELDAMTAPATLYPGWFTERLFDAKVREALQR